MRHNLALAAGLLGSTAGVLMAPAVLAQVSEVTDVQINAQDGGIEVVLETTDGDRPQIFTVNRGNSLVADVINTQLALPGGNGFLENDPAPGISSIAVTQLDSNSIRVKVDGIGTAPVGQVSQDNGRVVFNFSAGGTALEPAAAQEIPVEAPPPSIPDPEPSNEVAQTPAPTPPSEPLFEPRIEIDGLEARRQDLSNAAPTSLPRAIAPPVGDIAISALDPSPSTLILGTNEVIPRLVLRDAPVREVLSLLARAAGLNLAYVDGEADLEDGGSENDEGADGVTVSLDVENEPIQDIFNYVIRVSGVEASRFGRTIFVSPRLPDSARSTVVRTMRLNQVEAGAASTYLATLGAETREFIPQQTIRVTERDETTGLTSTRDEIVPGSVNTVEVDPGKAPLLIQNLAVTADPRLNSITLVGEPHSVEIAMQMLQQLDARQRQVAVNVKIVDVDLLATENFGTSFSFALDNDDIFFSNDGGSASLIYGGNRPPTAAERNASITGPPTIAAPIPDGVDEGVFFDLPPGTAPFNSGDPSVVPNQGSIFARPSFGTSDNPFQPGVSEVDDDGFELSLPGLYQFPSRFLAALEAQVVNNNAKILTDPTLIVQEGQAATVQLTQEVVTNITVNRDTTSGIVSETTEFELADAGLTLGVVLDRIDDNGFITLQVNPTVTSPTQTFDTGEGEITLLSTRNLQSGRVRLRDGQTLVLSGIISETDRTNVSKVPILGDLPIIGSLFRRTTRSNTRTEAVVLVTPEILDDSEFSDFGYGYVPQIETQQFINR